MKTFLANLNHAIRNNETVTIGGGQFTPADLRAISIQVKSLQAFCDKSRALAKSLQTQVDILKTAMDMVAAGNTDPDDLQRVAIEAFAALDAHKES